MKPFLLVSTRGEEEALDSEYQAYLRATGLEAGELQLAEFDLLGLPPVDPENYAGVFVAGSPYGAVSDDSYVPQTQRTVRAELEVLFKQLLEAGTPILATGSAMNILGDMLGAKVSDESAELAELVSIELTSEGQEDPVLAAAPAVFTAYVNHDEAIDEIPEGSVRLARSLYAPFQIIRYRDTVYATQFNPELDADVIASKTRAFEDAGDTGFGDVEALVSAGRFTSGQHDAAAVIRGFVKHFGGK